MLWAIVHARLFHTKNCIPPAKAIHPQTSVEGKRHHETGNQTFTVPGNSYRIDSGTWDFLRSADGRHKQFFGYNFRKMAATSYSD